MGTVYRGRDPFTGQEVAIKVCSTSVDSKQDDRLTRKLFYNEAQTAGALRHPNIVRVLDAGDEGGLPYLVMEYIAGGQSLRDFCAVDRLLPVRRVAQLIHGCCWGLDYAHR